MDREKYLLTRLGEVSAQAEQAIMVREEKIEALLVANEALTNDNAALTKIKDDNMELFERYVKTIKEQGDELTELREAYEALKLTYQDALDGYKQTRDELRNELDALRKNQPMIGTPDA